ncbi:MAG: glycoside hydrolase family 2 protein [Firmicutes bacterium]|nr:glycoside hydrolase family 2 protein [Bacillota bacterium]
MRKVELINDGWTWTSGKPYSDPEPVNLPHTWNGVDGQSGGGDYERMTCTYTKRLQRPEIAPGDTVYIQFRGVNSECEVFLNDESVAKHEGGYSTFNADITPALKMGTNILTVKVSNEPNDRVYPQRADFTFYGGIYRDVYMVILPKDCFEFGPDGGVPLKLSTKVEVREVVDIQLGGSNMISFGILTAATFPKARGDTRITVYEGDKEIAQGRAGTVFEFPNVRLWNGLDDPFLYTVKAELIVASEVVDEVVERCGFRSVEIDPKKGFFLNGKSYPLRGVCRHQDRPEVGNAISKEDQDEDMDIILEMGANTVRLAHYQHDQYFYDLCDEKGLVVWAEIPYISEYLPNGDENALSQMRELVSQNFNHPSIVCWGVSNEITIKAKPIKSVVASHQQLHDFCKKEDPERYTVVACYAMCGSGNPTARVTDLASWNLYYGWYAPLPAKGAFNRIKGASNKLKKPVGLSEYGAEGMPNLHSAKPKRLDNTEEYQCIYHEKHLELMKDYPGCWATHVWNLFDFGSDGRNQGGDPGKNHKGLVTFDRKIKKDAFYLYKAYWSKEPMIHIAGERFKNRVGDILNVKVYTNCKNLSLSVNGKLKENIKLENNQHVHTFSILTDIDKKRNEIIVRSGEMFAAAVFHKVESPDPSYTLNKKNKGNNYSWEKK